ncbi:MAG: hypothetical protein K6D97_08310 [Clostridia bacterium]|nr:hypothetical protein [Clostridia bacterium]
MKKLIIDSRMRKSEKELLTTLGYKIIELEKSKDVYEEISSHPDVFCTKIGNRIVVEPNTYRNLTSKVSEKDKFIIGKKCLGKVYPMDINYNVCTVGKYAIHNFKYTDETIVKLLEKNGYEMINVSQGYSNCSIAVIDDKSIITSDNGIYKKLKNLDLDILFIEPDNIKLLNNGVYSMKKGFVGGCLTKLKLERNGKNVIFVSGDLNKLNSGKKIRDFISDRNKDLIELPGLDVIDYGGMIEL